MAYLFADAIAGIVWLIFFFLRKDLRKEMLFMSLCGMPLALLDIFFVPTYWKPVTLFHFPVGIEGLLVSFLFSGIAAVAYTETKHMVPVKIHKYHQHASLIAVVLVLPLFFLLNSFHFSNVQICLFIALLIGIALTLFFRRDLVKSALFGTVIFGVLYSVSLRFWMVFFPDIKMWFVLQGLPKLSILDVPIYEVIFAMLFGAYWGNVYELVFGYKYRKKKK